MIASRATVTEAPIILSEGEEKKIQEEDLVLIKNLNGNEVLAICRLGRGLDENLEIRGAFKPTIAYVRRGLEASDAKRHYNFYASVIADVTRGFEQNKLIIAPGSTVYAFDEGDNPMNYLRNAISSDVGAVVGFYDDHEGWRIPIDPEYIPQHIGVFGVTGCGKSYLVRFEIIPMLRKAGYDVLIFDWKGTDYVPYIPKERIVKISDLKLPDDVVARYLARKARYFGYSAEFWKRTIYKELELVVLEGKWREKPLEERKRFIEEEVKKRLYKADRSGKQTATSRRDQETFERYWTFVTDDDIKVVSGEKSAEDLLEFVKEQHVVAIDMRYGSEDEKLSAFLSVADHLEKLMIEEVTLNLALIIDEGPQYAPGGRVTRGMQQFTASSIQRLCALGRSYKLAIVIVSQGMAGAIGIDAAVRRNLNTQFIGRIHPLDLEEAEKLLGKQGVRLGFLTRLLVGHFYIVGCLVPSPVPILMEFKPHEV